jgi:hypothetical protein
MNDDKPKSARGQNPNSLKNLKPSVFLTPGKKKTRYQWNTQISADTTQELEALKKALRLEAKRERLTVPQMLARILKTRYSI